MANKRISELDEKTTIADADMFPMVDEEATPDTTKKITGANLKSQILASFGHNDLSGMQGGTADEYYHLTESQHTNNVIKTGTLTAGQMVKANADGVVEDASNTDAEVADAVSKKHTQGTDTALGTLGTKDTPVDADKVIQRNSAASDALVTSTWSQIKAFLKTYFDGIYSTVTAFLGLSDTPSSYEGQALKVLRVKETEDGIEFSTGAGGMEVHGNEYHDPDFEQQGVAASLIETHRTTAEHTQPQPSNFLKLSDTPASYSGEAGKFPYVNDGEDALEFLAISGSTFPTSPVDGQIFTHEVTGRKITYIYDLDNTTWVPIISHGSMTLYVDKTDGTDDLNHGTGVDSDAFATVQYAIDCIPGLVGGDITININDEDYNEDVIIRGKKSIGDYLIILKGTLTLEETVSSATVAAGSGATQGTVTKAGAFAGDSYANLLAYFVTDDKYQLIDSHTDDVLTLVGVAPSSTSQDVKVYSWGTSINKITIDGGQQAIELYDIELDTATYGLDVREKADAYGARLYISSSARGVRVDTGGSLYLIDCYLSNNDYCFIADSNSNIALYACKLFIADASGYGYYVTYNSYGAFGMGSIIDATSKTGTRGIYAFANAVVSCYSSSAGGYCRIRNCDIGIRAELGAKVRRTENNQYSGNNTQESADAGTYAYID